jgi:hypothetical protein
MTHPEDFQCGSGLDEKCSRFLFVMNIFAWRFQQADRAFKHRWLAKEGNAASPNFIPPMKKVVLLTKIGSFLPRLRGTLHAP